MKGFLALCVFLAALLAGCGTLAPGASALRVTRDATLVTGCRSVGAVSGGASQLLGDWNGAGWYAVRNEAAALHATDLLLTSSRGLPDSGVAYVCTIR